MNHKNYSWSFNRLLLQKELWRNPMQGNIDRLREAMDEKGLREQEIEDPQSQQNQQNLGM